MVLLEILIAMRLSVNHIIYQRLMKLLLLIVVLSMEKDFVSIRNQKINGKTFVVPEYNLDNYEKFFLPKLDFKGMHHVYFNPDDIN